MIIFNIYDYKIFLETNQAPKYYREFFRDDSLLAEEIDIDRTEKDPLDSNVVFIAAKNCGSKKEFSLTLLLGYSPSDPAFYPELLYVPESQILFIRAGEKILAYQLQVPQKLFELSVDIGFLSWERYSNYIIMVAEMRMTVWNLAGEQLWTLFVEQPWSYHCHHEMMSFIKDEQVYTFPVATGPGKERM
ncbi:hypothetical protein [Tengunoibacter tsumagoiensis]|uniref:Uncharacterized protein n=1 Tax=Tengunoibacter tsumagoiensis TaxID=2014871 RepID=A0A402A4Q6_9CHLR|nr:hypothetical protein [Tengunoibacter tsumagoiensis]GCE14137.1 hypothetical protein KTT_39960 [Tengunoibacter tsumagoiensis]